MFGNNKKLNNSLDEFRADIDLTKCYYIDIIFNNNRYRTKCFSARRVKDKNLNLCVSLKDTHDFMLNASITLEFNMITGGLFSQSAIVIKKEDLHIVLELFDDLCEITNKRQSIKTEYELTGDVNYMNKKSEICIRDICIGGIKFCSCANLVIDSIYHINISELDINMKVKILRQNKVDSEYIYGCCFVDLSQKNEQRIQLYINELLLKKRQTLLQRDVYNYYIKN